MNKTILGLPNILPKLGAIKCSSLRSIYLLLDACSTPVTSYYVLKLFSRQCSH